VKPFTIAPIGVATQGAESCVFPLTRTVRQEQFLGCAVQDGGANSTKNSHSPPVARRHTPRCLVSEVENSPLQYWLKADRFLREDTIIMLKHTFAPMCSLLTGGGAFRLACAEIIIDRDLRQSRGTGSQEAAAIGMRGRGVLGVGQDSVLPWARAHGCVGSAPRSRFCRDHSRLGIFLQSANLR
jgi:hypothetical protein